MENPGLNRFFHGAVGLCIFSYGSYWLYLCCGEHWRRSIGSQNLILILFHLMFVVLSLKFFCCNKKKQYLSTAFMSFVPGVIVCFINRATRYPDFEKLIETFNEGHLDDAAYLAFQTIYSEKFLKYDYIVSRSSDASIIMAILQFIWFVFLMQKILTPPK